MHAPGTADRYQTARGQGRRRSGIGRTLARALVRAGKAVGRWRTIIVSIIATALVLGVIATLLMTTEFTASARIQVNGPGDIATGGAVDAADDQPVAGPRTLDRDAYTTQYVLLQARSIAVRVARGMRLAQNDGFFAAHGVLPPGGGQPPRLSPAQMRERERLAVELLSDHVAIVPGKGSSLIDIRYTSRSPAWSASIVNQWVRQFVDSSVERRFAATAGPRKFLEDRLADLRGKIEQAERNATLYASAAGIVPLDASRDDGGIGRTLASTDFEALNDAYHKAMAQRAAAKSQLTAGEAGTETQAASNPVLASLRARRAEVDADYARLSVQFKPAYPALMALAQERKALDEGIAKEERRARAALQSDYADAQHLEKSLRDEVGDLRTRLDRQSYSSIQYNVFRREAETDRQLYDGYLQRYKQLSVANVGPADISVVDLADVPSKPSSPRLIRNLALALLAGLVVAIVVTLILERSDESLRNPGEVPELFGVPLLGTTRDLTVDNAREQLTEPGSPLSEAFLKIATKLGATTGHGMPRSMMLTSTRQEEGKTTSTLAFAFMLARSGKKVAIVDADMRNPSLYASLDAHNDAGLSTFLAGQQDDWRALIQMLQPSGIAFLTAGPMPPGAAELLNSDRLALLVTQLTESFDHVIVDAPPMLDLADAPLIGRAVEGAVFVVSVEGPGIRAIRAATTRLADSGVRILGGIVTKVDEQNRNYRYDTL